MQYGEFGIRVNVTAPFDDLVVDGGRELVDRAVEGIRGLRGECGGTHQSEQRHGGCRAVHAVHGVFRSWGLGDSH